ncbi:hypothetical protein [Streptomyces sp. BK239]|uniref:hypothetical protein n=1 Tax=Streptomyces sp. BK239 TaxID=2512155 RepID=UPI00102B8A9A|nr:hypothetical protein [Streptomyces sp. BK239]
MRQWTRYDFYYLVVEEIAVDVVTFEVSRWPMLDEFGRPHFLATNLPQGFEEDESIALLSVSVDALHEKKRVHFGSAIQQTIRVDDAFGAAINLQKWAEVPEVVSAQDLMTLIPSPLYDVSAEARELARITRLASIVQPLEEKDAAVAEEHSGQLDD